MYLHHRVYMEDFEIKRHDLIVPDGGTKTFLDTVGAEWGWQRQEWIIGAKKEEGPKDCQPFPFVMIPRCFNSEMLEKESNIVAGQ